MQLRQKFSRTLATLLIAASATLPLSAASLGKDYLVKNAIDGKDVSVMINLDTGNMMDITCYNPEEAGCVKHKIDKDGTTKKEFIPPKFSNHGINLATIKMIGLDPENKRMAICHSHPYIQDEETSPEIALRNKAERIKKRAPSPNDINSASLFLFNYLSARELIGVEGTIEKFCIIPRQAWVPDSKDNETVYEPIQLTRDIIQFMAKEYIAGRFNKHQEVVAQGAPQEQNTSPNSKEFISEIAAFSESKAKDYSRTLTRFQGQSNNLIRKGFTEDSIFSNLTKAVDKQLKKVEKHRQKGIELTPPAYRIYTAPNQP
ncbi:hypothetical protein GOV11_02340 [Candidatus Woesearchaeota archaeon]|nr:hypothetical protein [Candidatus Woesearchaeota archaeon]